MRALKKSHLLLLAGLLCLVLAYSLFREKKTEQDVAAETEITENEPAAEPLNPTPTATDNSPKPPPSATVECPNGESAKTRAETAPALIEAITTAMRARNKEKLIEYASCHLSIGMPTSNDYAVAFTSQIAAEIMNTAANYSWQESGADWDNDVQKSFLSTGTTDNHTIVISRDPADNKWYWSGYMTSDPQLYKRISESAVPQSTEQPTDEEPMDDSNGMSIPPPPVEGEENFDTQEF